MPAASCDCRGRVMPSSFRLLVVGWIRFIARCEPYSFTDAAACSQLCRVRLRRLLLGPSDPCGHGSLMPCAWRNPRSRTMFGPSNPSAWSIMLDFRLVEAERQVDPGILLGDSPVRRSSQCVVGFSGLKIAWSTFGCPVSRSRSSVRPVPRSWARIVTRACSHSFPWFAIFSFSVLARWTGCLIFVLLGRTRLQMDTSK